MKTSRRTFGKAVAALAGSLLVPSWAPLLRNPPFDITDFCYVDRDSYGQHRYDITAPFAQSDFTYATDARICVRTTLIKPDHDSKEKRTPNAAGLLWSHDTVDRWQPWPRQNWIEREGKYGMTCPMCFSITPKDTKDCQACHGGGSTFDEHEREFKCESCNGRGWHGRICDYCDSEGSTHRPSLQVAGGLAISGWYDNKIRRLDCPEFAITEFTPPSKYHQQYNKLLLFRFNGGEGIVAPVLMQNT